MAGGFERLRQGDHRIEVSDPDDAREQDAYAVRLLHTTRLSDHILAGADRPRASLEVDRAVGLRDHRSAELLPDRVTAGVVERRDVSRRPPVPPRKGSQ